MPSFEPRSDPTSTSARWSRWLERFNTYLVAADIKDDGKKRALLLYQAGSEVYEIFKTLEEDEAKDFKSVVKALKKYFEPEKNVIYQTYIFRQATQGKEEGIHEFHTRLRGLAKHCEFADADFEIEMQIVTNGTSSRLRMKALQDPTYTLTNMLIDGRKYATSSAQADGIKERFKTKPKENINTTTMATPTKKKCYYCGFDYPHENRPCPAKNSVCNYCGVKDILLKNAVHEKTKNKEKTERMDLVHQKKGDRQDVTELRNNKQRSSKHHNAKRRTKAQSRIMFIPYRRNKTRKHTRMFQ